MLENQKKPLTNHMISKLILHAQKNVEGWNYDIRKALCLYSNITETQRQIIDMERQSILLGVKHSEILEKTAPEIYCEVLKIIGKNSLADLERRLRLISIDKYWADHLETVSEIRDGIHLVAVGGLTPFEEFMKCSVHSFDKYNDSIKYMMVDYYKSIKIIKNGIDIKTWGLHGPSSTWTYLMQEDIFKDSLAATLVNQHNIGYAIGAALTGPILLCWLFIKRLDIFPK